MLKKYNVTVNGKSYEVEVEEVRAAGTVTAPAAPKPANPTVSIPAPATAKPAAAPVPPAGATTVNAPMPGTILNLKVKQGDSVKRGDVLLILEAMKMGNEIFSPQDGTVSAIHVNQGSSVNTNDPLVSIS